MRAVRPKCSSRVCVGALQQKMTSYILTFDSITSHPIQANFKPSFSRFVKKQHKPLQLAIEDAVEEICETPTIGEAKTGDLHGIRVFKFMHQRREYLVAYRPPTDDEMARENVQVELLFIDFYQVGMHENFYADLKKYLKS